MGIADFYLKINFKSKKYGEFEAIYQSFVRGKIFRILDKEFELNYISVECKFDNLIPSVIIAFNNLSPYKDNIVSIETHGIIEGFIFTNAEEFLYSVFSINKSQLIAYYKQMGYLAIDSEKYYENRNKLKKYYKKLK